MSTLDGFSGPVFPGGASSINSLRAGGKVDRERIAAAARQVPNFFLSLDLPTTSDDAQWYVAAIFKVGEGQNVEIFFPFPSEEEDSVSVFYRGVGLQCAESVVDQLAAALEARA